MIDTIIDTIDKWCSNNYPVTCGLILLAGAFLLSFCYKTAWGRWKEHKKDDEIYSKPGVNIDKKKHPTHQER